ncbi:MAG: hypothetical protein OEU84_15910, partial [Xanthomonadales bacterium]|nr:hypothetical protein [Xanthomonadales bacterium]
MSMNNQKTWIVVAGLAVVIAGVAFLSNDFPSGSEQASGTIVPAERYRGEQISFEERNLGDQGVALLMQTDVFELVIKDPQFRALASDPAFMVLAQHPQALAAMAQSPQAFVALASHP